MAQQIVIIDDLDGTAGAQTVTFALAGRPWEIDLNDKNREKLEKALQPFIDKARPAGTSPAAKVERRMRSLAAAGKPERTDYTDLDNIGLEHRGRVTEAEARLVRENLDRANANRAREGQTPIDPSDAKMKKRYAF